MSFRGHIWTDTDNARCGLLPFAFRDDAGFVDYVEWALDVPMYFILRGGRYRTDVTGVPFRRFLERGRRRRARDDRRLEPPPDDALPRGAAQGLHRAALRRQPAAGAHARAAGAREGRLLHAATASTRPGTCREALELRGTRRRSIATCIARRSARASAASRSLELARELLRDRRGGAAPPARARRRGRRRARLSRAHAASSSRSAARRRASSPTKWDGEWERRPERLVAATAYRA